MEVKYLGHAGFLLSSSGTNILIDPFLNNSNSDPSFKRLIKAPLKKEDLPKIDLILVSHEHFDHFDKKTIEFLQKRDSCLVVGHSSLLDELNLPKASFIAVQAPANQTLRKIRVEVKPAHHPQSFYPLSFLLDFDGKKIFHSGDTTLTDSFNGLKADLAFLPIGGTFTMDLVDAVKATKVIKPEIVIPMHYNTFDLIKADPNDFKQRIEKSVIDTKAIVLEPGQTYKF